MILAIPAATDAYVRALKASGDLGTTVVVLDGPSPIDAGMEGVAVGASLQDRAGDFTVPASDMSSDTAQTFTLTCTAWARSGDTTFKAARDRVSQIVSIADNVLAADRTLGGTVSTAWIADGIFEQQLNEAGIVVTIEFRIEATVF
jgi:hypothetical protein